MDQAEQLEAAEICVFMEAVCLSSCFQESATRMGDCLVTIATPTLDRGQEDSLGLVRMSSSVADGWWDVTLSFSLASSPFFIHSLQASSHAYAVLDAAEYKIEGGLVVRLLKVRHGPLSNSACQLRISRPHMSSTGEESLGEQRMEVH